MGLDEHPPAGLSLGKLLLRSKEKFSPEITKYSSLTVGAWDG